MFNFGVKKGLDFEVKNRVFPLLDNIDGNSGMEKVHPALLWSALK